MGATAAWRAYAAQQGAKIYPVVSITRSDAQQFHFAVQPFAYFKADLVRIDEVKVSFDETGGSVPLPALQFVHSNAGREFERILEGPVAPSSARQCLRRVSKQRPPIFEYRGRAGYRLL